MDLQSLINKPRPPLIPRNGQHLEDMLVQAKASATGLDGNIFLHMGVTEKTTMSMFQLILSYKENEPSPSPEDFIEYIRSIMTEDLCREAERSTVSQSKSTEWYELRFGRITASIIYEASRCKTKEGSLVEAILGGAKHIETDAIERGLLLESQLNMNEKHLEENFAALLEDVITQKPKRAGDFITRCYLSSPPSREKFKVDFAQYISNKIASSKDGDAEEEVEEERVAL
ncbi:unnamed protein product [Ceutorhynchus assimilis]|uniref:Uncharacterized protein n=1 Tax=Ceutorhynchus assimilis TaxID=467358 RepID=A0A9N9QIS3_9CUCU|nr:unnamed protein product [Ceutorhynchus assimilis]